MTDTESGPRTPNEIAVRRIARHLLGEDVVNIRAAMESFPTGYTVVPKAEAERSAGAAPIDVETLTQACESRDIQNIMYSLTEYNDATPEDVATAIAVEYARLAEGTDR